MSTNKNKDNTKLLTTISILIISFILFSFLVNFVNFDNFNSNIIHLGLDNGETDGVVVIVPNSTFESKYYVEFFETRYMQYHEDNPLLDLEQVVSDVNMNKDYDFYGYITFVNNPNDCLAICNKYYAVYSDFVPDDLVKIPEGYYISDGKEYYLKDEALSAFINMSDDAKLEDIQIKTISAYRSYEYQSYLYDLYTISYNKDADTFSTKPGHSEHQLGLAIDINSLSESFEFTDEYKWLEENAYKYGYILRYPKNTEEVTGFVYEPWHYRYVGIYVAKIIHDSNITFDQYYAENLLPFVN